MAALFSDRIRTAKQLNRTSGRILAEAREHPVTVVTEGEDAVVMQSRASAARQAHAEALLRRLAPLFAYLLSGERTLPHELRWVADLHTQNAASFRRALPLEVERATRTGAFERFDDWLYDWQVAAEVDADARLRRRLRLRG